MTVLFLVEHTKIIFLLYLCQEEFFEMKYAVRALKYFLYISVILTLILGGLMLVGAVSTDIDKVFKEGWKSLGWIALMFACVSAVYPKFGYAKRPAAIPGETAEIRDGIIAYMQSRDYVLEKTEGDDMTFRSRSFLFRLFRVWEDRITLTRELGGYQVEGPNRDIVRIVYGLEERFRNKEAQS